MSSNNESSNASFEISLPKMSIASPFSSDDTEVKIKPKRILSKKPTQQLNRFSSDLKEGGQKSVEDLRILRINKERVNRFVNKPFDEQPYKEYNDSPHKKQTNNQYDYPEANFSSNIELQTAPEFQHALGDRSRFGDGDGSFFDRWLNSGVGKNNLDYDQNGLPKAGRDVNVLSGFKFQYDNKIKSKLTGGKLATVSLYSERRKNRIDREKQEIDLSNLTEPIDVKEDIKFQGNGMLDAPWDDLDNETLQTNVESNNDETAIDSIKTDIHNKYKKQITKTQEDLKLPKISNTEKDLYFGNKARASFYDFYRQLSRQRYTINSGQSTSSSLSQLLQNESNTNEVYENRRKLLVSRMEEKFNLLLEEEGFSKFPNESMSEITNTIQFMEDMKDQPFDDNTVSPEIVDHFPEESPENYKHMYNVVNDAVENAAVSFEDAPVQVLNELAIDEAVQRSSSPNGFSCNSRLSSPSDATNNLNLSLDNDLISNIGRPKISLDARSEVDDLHLHLPDSLHGESKMSSRQRINSSHSRINTARSRMSTTANTSRTDDGSERPLSARTKFIVALVDNGMNPKPSLIVRKQLSNILDVSSQSMGDDTAILFANALNNMPMLTDLKVADNRLTDPGLTAIILALSNCPNVTNIDISRNKVDDDAAGALADYLSSGGCMLRNLVMQNADCDDNEVSNFAEAIGVRNTLKLLDMSGNLLGSHEVASFVNEDQSTGGAALGKLLSNPSCSLETLILSWNTIRLSSAVALSKSLQLNQSLTHLDLSYNGFADQGGDTLGNALHSHKTLKYLNIANNNIRPRACFIIMSGIKSCQTLRSINLTSNLIGEVGARALVSVNVALGDEVEVEIKGCSLKIVDSDAWFDSRKPSGSYSFNLSRPYDRSICIELLRLSADNDELTFSKFNYAEDKSSSKRDLEFLTQTIKKVSRITNKSVAVSDKKVNTIADISGDIDKATNLFLKYDEDNSGALDRFELASVLEELGLGNARATVEQLLAVYDIDGTGLVEMAEFTQFLNSLFTSGERAKAWASESRYLILKEHAVPENSTKIPPEYFPPDFGFIDCVLQHHKTVPDFLQTISPENVQTVLNATKAVADGAAMIELALTSMKLRFEEAFILYRQLMKENGDKLNALVKLIPRIVYPADTCRLLNATITDVSERTRLKLQLGGYFNISVGLPNGHYSLNFNDEADRVCFESLADLNETGVTQRKSKLFGDTSQNGDWFSFRNVLLDGQPFEITLEWLETIPHSGRIDFDFVSFADTTVFVDTTQALSNLRIFNLINAMELVIDKTKFSFLKDMTESDDYVRAGSKGSGRNEYVKDYKKSDEIAKNVNVLYEKYEKRVTDDIMYKDLHKEEEIYFEFNKSCSKPDNSKSKKHLSTHAPSVNNSSKAHDPSSVDIYVNYINKMRSSGMVSVNVISLKICEVYQDVLSGRYISCVQLSYLVRSFPICEVPFTHLFTTIRVDFIIRMLTLLVDLINIEIVLAILTPKEVALIIFRVGYLNIWNPMKPEGCISLNLARREEKQLFRILYTLQWLELPSENWRDCNWTAIGAEVIKYFDIPSSWFLENTIPDAGQISGKYYSGDGLGIMECKPNIMARYTFLVLCLSNPYKEDMKGHAKYTLDRADQSLEDSGIGLRFDTEKQTILKAVKGSGAKK
jgi:Ran GTPase-activating protein (RanGAP) involved in mRNA processing and transport